MTKVIHEYYYVVGFKDFSSYYKLVVDRETEKMLYGDACDKDAVPCGGFAIKKSVLNEVHEVADRKRGLVLRVMVDDDVEENAYRRAKEAIYRYLTRVAERFLLHEREN